MKHCRRIWKRKLFRENKPRKGWKRKNIITSNDSCYFRRESFASKRKCTKLITESMLRLGLMNKHFYSGRIFRTAWTRPIELTQRARKANISFGFLTSFSGRLSKKGRKNMLHFQRVLGKRKNRTTRERESKAKSWNAFRWVFEGRRTDRQPGKKGR